MTVKVTDKVDQKPYDRVVELLAEYNNSKTEQFANEINKPIEIIVRLYGRSIWGTLEIKTFVVKSEKRNIGIEKKNNSRS